MRRTTTLLCAAVTLTLLLPAWTPAPPLNKQQKQARAELRVTLREMLKEQRQDQLEAMDTFRSCLLSLRSDLLDGAQPVSLLEPLRDCLDRFVERIVLAEHDSCLKAMTRAGKLLGNLGGTAPGFGRGDGQLFDQAMTRLRSRSRTRLDQGLRLLDRTLVMRFEAQDYTLCVRARAPELDFAVMVEDDVLIDRRPAPWVAVMVAGSSLSQENDGVLFLSGYSHDPDWSPGLDDTPRLDAVELECRQGITYQKGVPLVGMTGEPLGEDNPPVRWFASFWHLDDKLVSVPSSGSLPEGNALVRAVQHGVVGTASIGIP